jgi:hypothetical protein
MRGPSPPLLAPIRRVGNRSDVALATTQTREEEWDWARQGMIEELSRA